MNQVTLLCAGFFLSGMVCGLATAGFVFTWPYGKRDKRKEERCEYGHLDCHCRIRADIH